MTKKTMKHLQPGPLEDAKALVQTLGGEDYQIPQSQKEDLEHSEPPSSKTDVADKSAKRPAKIRFNQGLGWSEETQTWWIHIRVGKKFHTEDTGIKKFDEAKIWLFNFRRRLVDFGQSGEIPGLTLGECLDLWARDAPNDYENRKRPCLDRVKDVVATFRLWVLPKLGKKKVKDITRQDLNEVTQIYRDADGPNGKHTAGGVRNFLVNLNTVIRWAYKTGKVSFITRLPVVPQPIRKNPVIVPFNTVWKVLEGFDHRVGYDIYAMAYIRVLAFCGVRTDNVRSLDKGQFNEDLTVFNTGTTKNGENYNLPIPEEVREFLLLIPDIHEPGLLLRNGKGEKRSAGWCLKAFKEACLDAGITAPMAWHRLRATCATMLIRAGADMFVLKKALGWKTLEVAQFYISTETEDIARVQRKGIDSFKRHSPDGK